jgi:glycerol-3-phosphate dehydrogenase (NAD(P)+)
MQQGRENRSYLPGFHLAANVCVTASLELALRNASIVLLVTPSHHLRTVLEGMLLHLNDSMSFVSASKGLENNSLLRMSEVLECTVARRFPPQVAVLSGPTFAREIAAGQPAAVVIASKQESLARQIQGAFSGPAFRLYTNSDVVGVEIGAALKNVIAIGAGICQGLGLGSNTLAALITRGLAEITRLAVALGAQPKTLAGLAGLGDLVLTCNGELSRNRRVGMELAKGISLDDVVRSSNMVAEGIQTTFAAVDLAAKHGVDMPITQQMDQILRKGRSPMEGLRELMDRSLKPE